MAIFTVWNKSTQHERSRVQVQNTLLVHRKLWCIAPFEATFKFTISDKQFQFSSAKSYIHVYSIYLLAADMIDAIQAWKQNKDSNYLPENVKDNDVQTISIIFRPQKPNLKLLHDKRSK